MTWKDTSRIRRALDLQEIIDKANIADYLDELQTAVDGKAVKAQANAVSDLGAVTFGDTYSKTEVQGAYDNIKTALNAILAALRTAGIIKTS